MSRLGPRESLWLPFTANQAFKRSPYGRRVLQSAKGMFYFSEDGHRILDGTSGLWCVNLGHSNLRIKDAISSQLECLDFAPTFQLSHPKAFEFADRAVNELIPKDWNLRRVFFTTCGSTAVDTALKIAIAYWRSKGLAAKTRFIGQHRAYHGVGFGGISVGGIPSNRIMFSSSLLPSVDHLPHSLDLSTSAFSKGQPITGGTKAAKAFESLISLQDASTIAALIVEPVAGSTGVIVPPIGHLKALREMCSRHGILLIFDEVITGFGRVGGKGFAAEFFNVEPDMIISAKGITNGTVPCGAVFVKEEIYDSVVNQRPAGIGGSADIEFPHGYTYSGHPLAMAAGLAALDAVKEDNVFEHAAQIQGYWEESLHSLRNAPNVVDIRNIGLMGAVELQSIPGKPGQRAFEVFLRALDTGALIRVTGDVVALSPPLITEKEHIDKLISILGDAIEWQGKNPGSL